MNENKNGKEIMHQLARAKMPDREQVRKNCHEQMAQKQTGRRFRWSTAAAILVGCIILATGVFAAYEHFSWSEIIDMGAENGEYERHQQMIALTQRQIEQQLMSLQGIENAVIDLTIPQQQSPLSGVLPVASTVITTTRDFTVEELTSIAAIVAANVTGLGSENVTIEVLDTYGEVREPTAFGSVAGMIEAMPGHENAVFNLPLIPDESLCPITELDIVSVIFVCNQHTSGTPPRDLRLSTPASFTVPGQETMNADTDAIFNGWVDANGTLIAEGTLVVFEVESSGIVTLIASWS